MLLIYNNPAALAAMPDPEREGLMAEVDTIVEELTASGEWVGGAALADPAMSRTVRVRNGVPATTDGPYAEAKEQLAGYLVVDAADVDRATEIAARWPDAKYWAMEVRPIVNVVDTEV
ncbi:YciI family protein [Sphaerisporangium corydalis]|uniref:YciI family protein n=1 Tax=Sphaerisporangium corydalis TaxID=1441875 RepID=A0ABV9EKM0_9ACTN|nr:YciI family protein [Sphaerisporangium corydalis]